MTSNASCGGDRDRFVRNGPPQLALKRLVTVGRLRAQGVTRDELRWGEHTGRWRRIARGVYREGPEPATALEVALAPFVRTGEVVGGALAGVLLGLDSVRVEPVRRRPRSLNRAVVIDGWLVCTDGLQTLIDLAATFDDDRWEQALESALRMGLCTVADLEAALPELGRARAPGTARIRRVLERRPPGPPPTESLLETLMVQLVRRAAGVPDPRRQVVVENGYGEFVARVDLAWPDLGLFVELDGQHHPGQPVYDARRETAVVAATGWLCGRFTWTEVVHHPVATTRRLAAIVGQARRRPAA